MSDVAFAQINPSVNGSKTGWRTVRFGDVVRNVDSSVRNPLEQGIERFVGLEHLDPESLHVKRWGNIADGTSFTRKFSSGQVLFGKRRAYQRKAAVADFDGICSGDILVFEPKTDELLPELLPFIVQSDGFFEHALGTSAGSLSPRTKWSDMARYEFALPPKDEQRRITEIFKSLNYAIGNFGNVFDSTQQLIVSLKEEFFNSSAQKDYTLKELCESDGIRIGPFGSQLHASDYVSEGVPVVMPSDMKDDAIVEQSISKISSEMADKLSMHKVQVGDILLPRRGELDRRAFITAKQAGWICGTGSIRIRIKKSIPSLAVFYALSTPKVIDWLRENAVGTTMPNLNKTIVSNIPLKLPKTDKLNKAIEMIEAANKALNSVENKKKALINLRKRIFINLLQENV